MPDHSNEATRSTEARLGDFVFDREGEDEDGVVTRGPFEMDNGAIYQG